MSTVKRDRLAQQAKRRQADEIAKQQQRASLDDVFGPDDGREMTPKASQPGKPGKGRTQ
ncbi:MAG: hypothetical protein ACOYB2_10475 [Limnohabitans sp.]